MKLVLCDFTNKWNQPLCPNLHKESWSKFRMHVHNCDGKPVPELGFEPRLEIVSNMEKSDCTSGFCVKGSVKWVFFEPIIKFMWRVGHCHMSLTGTWQESYPRMQRKNIRDISKSLNGFYLSRRPTISIGLTINNVSCRAIGLDENSRVRVIRRISSYSEPMQILDLQRCPEFEININSFLRIKTFRAILCNALSLKVFLSKRHQLTRLDKR